MNTPSHRQQAVYNTWQNENCNILIGAVAGSGKTTTLMGLLEMCKHRTLFLAFNKSIQEEIQNTINTKKLIQGKAMTMHSLGYTALKSCFSNITVYNSSEWAERGFCAMCGTHLFYRLKQIGLYHVPLGLFGDQVNPEFEKQVFIDKKPSNYSFKEKNLYTA